MGVAAPASRAAGFSGRRCLVCLLPSVPSCPSKDVTLVQVMYYAEIRQKSSLHVHVTYSLIHMGFLTTVALLCGFKS